MARAQVLGDSDLRRVLAFARSKAHAERNVLVLMLSYFAGLRVKEIAALQVEDVYDARMSPRSQFFLRPEKTKGKYGRTVYLSERLRKQLEFFRKQEALGVNDMPKALIRSQKGGPFSANSLCQVMARLYDEAGFPSATSHTGRRSFITHLAHRGISAKVLMQLAGHRHLGTTQVYIDVNENQLANAVEVL
jgi:integrase/recombinase XerD